MLKLLVQYRDARWSQVCHVQHRIHAGEFSRSHFYFVTWHVLRLGSENWTHTAVTGVVHVCVLGLPVQGEGLGGQCAEDDRGCL